jgi:hypothetical protein
MTGMWTLVLEEAVFWEATMDIHLTQIFYAEVRAMIAPLTRFPAGLLEKHPMKIAP